MIGVRSSVVIDRPIEEVFRYVSDFENDTAWYQGVLESKRISETKEGAGARYWQRSRLLGRQYETEFEVTEYDPPKHLRMRSSRGAVPFVATYILEPVAGGTRFTMDAGVEATGLYRLIQPLFVLVLRRQTGAFFEKLRRLMESRT